jgi:hypothetical protein
MPADGPDFDSPPHSAAQPPMHSQAEHDGEPKAKRGGSRRSHHTAFQSHHPPQAPTQAAVPPFITGEISSLRADMAATSRRLDTFDGRISGMETGIQSILSLIQQQQPAPIPPVNTSPRGAPGGGHARPPANAPSIGASGGGYTRPARPTPFTPAATPPTGIFAGSPQTLATPSTGLPHSVSTVSGFAPATITYPKQVPDWIDAPSPTVAKLHVDAQDVNHRFHVTQGIQTQYPWHAAFSTAQLTQLACLFESTNSKARVVNGGSRTSTTTWIRRRLKTSSSTFTHR